MAPVAGFKALAPPNSYAAPTAISTPAPAIAEVDIAPDEAMVSISCGGGGYGHPHERDPERVAHDVREGWVKS